MKPSMLEAALALAGRGMAVFPLKPGSKIPIHKGGFKNATRDEAKIRAWWDAEPRANIGVATGALSNRNVLDVDTKNGHDGEATLQGLKYALPDTVESRTPSGGRHLWFECTLSIRNSAGKLGDGLDVRGDGGYVVAPPSVIEGQGAYKWIKNGSHRFAPTPDWMCQGAPPKPPEGPGASDKIPEGRRNDTLSRFAFSMRRSGLSVPAIEVALIAEDALRCDPPLGADECRKIARGKSIIDGEEVAKWPAPLDLLRLSRTDPQPPQFIVPDWLPCGYATMFAGHGGVGKSGIALHLGSCIAVGQPFFGLPVQQRKVLYLCCEDRENILHWRLSRITQHEKISIADLNGKLFLLDLVGRPSVLWERDPRTGNALTAAYGQLAERMKEFGPEVVIVDGVADTFGGNENARSEVKAYVNALLGLIDPERGAVLLIAHINRTTALNVETSEGYSGSTQWHNAVRARWYLYPEMEADEDSKGPKLPTGNLFLKVQKSNLGKKAEAMVFAWDEEAKMFLAQEVVAMAPDDLEHREREEAEWLLRAIVKAQDAGVPVLSATSGRRTSFHVLSAMLGFPEALRRSKTRFWRHLEVLRSRRHIEEDTILKNRNKTGVLVATEVGREVASGEFI